MGTTQISLCVFLGCVIAVQSVLYHNGRFTQDVVGVYENRVPFSFGRNFDFTPQGTIFNSWRSWTPDFHRGQLVNLQVLAKTRINQEAFIQSCFVSVFPEPRAKPRQTVIFNKGCVTPLGSSTTRVTFVASNSADAVNFVLNTSYLISELYIHCSVLISGQGVTPGSKSCNYNVIESRYQYSHNVLVIWRHVSAVAQDLLRVISDAKAVVSTGPFVIVDEDGERTLPSIAEEESANVPNSMQSALPDLADVIVSSVPRSKFNAGPEGVVAVSQDPATRLTLWLPEQVPPQSDSNDITKLHSSTTNQEPHPNPTNEIKGQSFSSVSPSTMNLPTMVNGWKSPPHPAVPEDFKRKSWSGRSGNFDSKEEPVNFSLPAEISVKYLMLVERPNSAELDNTAAVEESQSEKWLQNEIKDPNHDDLPQMLTDGAMMPEGTDEIPPITRSKLSFSKAADGSQTLSYEEEAVVHKTSPVERKQLKLKGLHSTFLNLLR
uniref:ZP domain-containing protein n=1 Tax=Astatotilapia calliptera TaxID=8154 RepID=A0A3P8QHM9_ASTCA